MTAKELRDKLYKTDDETEVRIVVNGALLEDAHIIADTFIVSESNEKKDGLYIQIAK